MSVVHVPMVEQSLFVYGSFGPEVSISGLLGAPELPGSSEPSIAIEILREFSPSEFIGKVFVRRYTEWRPLTPEAASKHEWFQRVQKGGALYFDIKGSGKWEVEWFRFESSSRNPNPYVAVALKQRVAEASNGGRTRIVSQTGPVS